MITTDEIDWQSSQSHVLLNPTMPGEERKAIIASLESIDSLLGHVWLSTSGSSGTMKFVALSKKAILISAAAVNTHLQCQVSDIWINCLPTFHIGGLAIKARCYLSGGKIINFRNSRWNPHQFVEQMIKAQATLTSLVPAQIYDLVQEKLFAPSQLRAVVVGGGAMSEKIYEQAIVLGWKLLPSYGLTECASQIATAPLNSWECGHFPLLKPLEHINLTTDKDGLLHISGESLLTYYGLPNSLGGCQLSDPKVNGWLKTEDRVIFKNEYIQSISREGNFVKIGGESVDLLRLDNVLEEIKFSLKNYEEMSIFAMPDSRLGHVIHLAIGAERISNIEQLLKLFQEHVHPYERIREVHYVESIPRTPLKKILRQQILEKIKK